MSMLRSFWVQGYLSYRGNFRWLTIQGYFSNNILEPVLGVLMFGYLSRFAVSDDLATFIIIGVSVGRITTVVTSGVLYAFADEQRRGSISAIFLAPTARWTGFLSRGIPHIPNGFVGMSVTFLAAAIVLGLDFSRMHWPGLVLSAILISTSCAAFGLLAANFSISFRDAFFVNNMSLGVLLLFTGTVIPLTALPEPLGTLSRALPVTNALIGLRQAFEGAPLSETGVHAAREAAVIAAYTAAALAGFRIVEWRSRLTGILEREGA